jgi:DNA-binding response OmpR family regulator
VSIVLIGEDEPDVTLALKTIFSRAGYRVLTAADGVTILEMARHWKPDLMILDIAMPHMSGLDVCRAVRAQPEICDTPVMMVSGWGFTTDMAAGTEAGADDYVVKPFEKDDLLTRANRLIAARAEARQAAEMRRAAEPRQDADAQWTSELRRDSRERRGAELRQDADARSDAEAMESEAVPVYMSMHRRVDRDRR